MHDAEQAALETLTTDPDYHALRGIRLPVLPMTTSGSSDTGSLAFKDIKYAGSVWHITFGQREQRGLLVLGPTYDIVQFRVLPPVEEKKP